MKFVVARKWNSWYPSYFDTEGGCYAFITRDSNRNMKENKGAIVIDPGFKFWDILRKFYNLEPHDVRSIIVSHYHPDHSMGLYELLTVTNETEYPYNYYLNKTSFEAFKPFQGKYNKIVELTEGERIRLVKYTPLIAKKRSSFYDNRDGNKNISIDDGNLKEEIFVEILKTFHREIGNRSNSIGLKFLIKTDKEEQELVILGDTDGSRIYIDRYLNYMKDAKIIVLHLGSFTEQSYGDGNKHLYKNGLIDILNCINCITNGYIKKEGRIIDCIKNKIISCTNNPHIIKNITNDEIIKYSYIKPGPKIDMCNLKKTISFNNLKLVLISELGLEMAPTREIIDSFRGFKWFKDFYPFFLFLKFSDDHTKIIHSEIFSTKAFLSIRYFLKDEDPSMEFLIKTYTFMSFLGNYFICKMISDIDKMDPTTKRVEIFLDKINKIYSQTGQMRESEINTFIDNFSIHINKILRSHEINTIETDIQKIVKDFVESVYLSYYKDTSLTSRSYIAEEINAAFKRMVGLPAMIKTKYSEEGIENDELKADYYDNYWDKSVEDMLIFFSSTSIIPHNVLNLLEKKFENEGMRTFDSLIYFTAIEIIKIMNNYTPTQIDDFDKDFRCTGLANILQKYSNNCNNIKFFITNCGIELDLSDELRIKSYYNKDWINLGNAVQDFECGEYRLYDKNKI